MTSKKNGTYRKRNALKRKDEEDGNVTGATRIVALGALVSVGLGAWLGMHADTARFSAATARPVPVERVTCTSTHGSCGGYAGWHDTARGKPFTRITGTLTVPRVNCAGSKYITAGQFKGQDGVWSWLGLGGDPGPTVGQAGVLLLCNKGQRYPQIWEWTTVMTAKGAPIRWYQEAGVKAGDQVYVSVQAVANTYRLVLKIPAIGWSLADQMPCPVARCDNNTAEAVVEAIAHDDVPVFTGAHFAGIRVWDGRDGGAFGANPRWSLGSNTVARPGGGVLITRGRLLDGGTAFSPQYVVN